MQTAYELAKKNYGRTWTIEMLQKLVEKDKLSVKDYIEITQSSPEDLIDSIDNIKAQKLNELIAMCDEAIYDGIDVETTEGVEHFSLELEDQINLKAQYDMVTNGIAEVPYHADGKGCRKFTSDEIINIVNHAYMYKTYITTYFNQLKQWVLRCETIEEINSIAWGSELPDDLDTIMVELTGTSTKQPTE